MNIGIQPVVVNDDLTILHAPCYYNFPSNEFDDLLQVVPTRNNGYFYIPRGKKSQIIRNAYNVYVCLHMVIEEEGENIEIGVSWRDDKKEFFYRTDYKIEELIKKKLCLDDIDEKDSSKVKQILDTATLKEVNKIIEYFPLEYAEWLEEKVKSVRD